MRGLCLVIIFSTLFSTTFAQSNFLVSVLEEEQKRAMSIFKEKTDLPPYFLSYLVTETQSWGVSASQGFLLSSGGGKNRTLDTILRVGDFKLDNTHNRTGFRNSRSLPLEDDKDAIKSVLWTTTDRIYKDAVESYTQIKTRQDTRAIEENLADDFAPNVAKKELAQPVLQKVDLKNLEVRAKKISAVFKKYPQIFTSGVNFSISATNRYFVSSEGASLQHGKNLVTLAISASTRAEDGMDLSRFETFSATTVNGLPNDEELLKVAEKVAKDVLDLKNAPLADPFDGPAILSGRANGVFFHEIFGHRIEGHRQKGNTEGNTFTKRVNQEILPNFLSVVDDPTVPKFGATELNGFYQFDEEGVSAQKVPLVENGILKNFLMSRSPIQGFANSNGHGRASAGLSPVSRQGNLFVQTKQTVSNKKLREMLLAEVKKQGKTFGLFLADISGGFTSTQRAGTQSFQVNPIMVYRVYADGRPDELVRGVDLIGTPLTSFSKIIAADDKPEIFNGMCGAESGWVPVSAISPAILVSQIETQKRAKSNRLLPILPPPSTETLK